MVSHNLVLNSFPVGFSSFSFSLLRVMETGFVTETLPNIFHSNKAKQKKKGRGERKHTHTHTQIEARFRNQGNNRISLITLLSKATAAIDSFVQRVSFLFCLAPTLQSGSVAIQLRTQRAITFSVGT